MDVPGLPPHPGVKSVSENPFKMTISKTENDLSLAFGDSFTDANKNWAIPKSQSMTNPFGSVPFN